jgi:hypothetical protein
MNECVWNTGRITLAWENWSDRTKTCPSVTSCTANLTRNILGTVWCSRLSHGMAFSYFVLHSQYEDCKANFLQAKCCLWMYKVNEKCEVKPTRGEFTMKCRKKWCMNTRLPKRGFLRTDSWRLNKMLNLRILAFKAGLERLKTDCLNR